MLASMAWVAVLYAIVIWYQHYAGFAYGLDSTTPEFDKYWMSIFWTEIVVIPIAAAIWWLYLWLTRDKHLDKLAPEEELVRYYRLLGFIMSYTFCVYWAGSFFAEQDASWHQTVMRDTSLTPSHIFIFYLSFPVYIAAGVASFLYATTRLPKFAGSISVPFVLAVAGPFMILPNVGFNEWGHAFWIMEEWFTAPLHWGFVALGWTALGIFGLAAQICLRLIELIKIVHGLEDSDAGA
jgi:methane/ammonia monooxygenase subunit C